MVNMPIRAWIRVETGSVSLDKQKDKTPTRPPLSSFTLVDLAVADAITERAGSEGRGLGLGVDEGVVGKSD